MHKLPFQVAKFAAEISFDNIFQESRHQFEGCSYTLKAVAFHPTWHDDFREAHLASHSCRSVHQVRKVLPDLMDVARQQLQSHPQAWRCDGGKIGEESDRRRQFGPLGDIQ